MELLEQCRKWHEHGEHRRIADALEAVPEAARTPELDMELARAYNNLAEPDRPEGRALLRRAIELMLPHEGALGETHSWNFRMGYAYYYLDQEGPALRYFQRSMERYPDNDPGVNSREEVQSLLDDCGRRLALPRFAENFRERTEKAWNAFAQGEAELRRGMDADRNRERGGELIARCSELLHLAFDDITLEMGFNGERHELILSPEGDKVRLFELVYFRRRAPKAVLEHWNILVGRQRCSGFALRLNGWEVSGDDVRVWVEERGEGRVGLTLYCKKLLPLLREDAGRAWWMLANLTDQVLGEIANMAYVDAFEVADAPRRRPSIPLTRLPQALEERGLSLALTPEDYLDRYAGYQMKPSEDPDDDWRLDVIAGSTNCLPLLGGYLHGESGGMDRLHADGAAAGFFCYPLDGFDGEDRSQQLFAFRDALEEALLRRAGEEALTLTGGATGVFCGYVDFIAWDLRAVLDAAKDFFADSPLPWADFHVFRRGVGTVRLLDRDGGPDAGERAAEG